MRQEQGADHACRAAEAKLPVPREHEYIRNGTLCFVRRAERSTTRGWAAEGLVGLDDLDGAEAWEWPAGEEHLDRDVGLDVGPG